MASLRIVTRKGLDVPVDGAPAPRIEAGARTGSVALLGADYIGLEPRMLVREDERVMLGQPLFQQKRDPDICFTAPASGVVKRIWRGARRVLQAVEIACDGEGEEVMSHVLDELVVNGDIPDGSFEYTAPEGAAVRDMSGGR